MKKLTLVLIILMVLTALAGCSKEPSKEVSAVIYEGMDKEWSIEIPDKYVKDNEEKKEASYFITYKTEGGEILNIEEKIDSDSILSKENIEKELKVDDYIHINRFETLEIEDVGKVYGAYLEDRTVNGYAIMYKFRVKDKVVSILVYKTEVFTEQEEGEIKSIISNIEIK